MKYFSGILLIMGAFFFTRHDAHAEGRSLLYLTSDKSAYEVGEGVSVALKANASTTIFKDPRVVLFTLTRPDKTLVRATSTVQNAPIRCYPIDPIPGRGSQVNGPACDYEQYFTGQSVLFSDALTMTGTYTVTAALKGGGEKIKEYGFRATSNRINSLFINGTIGGYRLNKKWKQVVSGTPVFESASHFQALYYHTSRYRNLGQSKEAQLENPLSYRQENAVTIRLMRSVAEATEQVKNERGTSSKTAVSVKGNVVFMIEQADGYVVWWPSRRTVVVIEGFQSYGNEEKTFVAAYLKKYPSTLLGDSR